MDISTHVIQSLCQIELPCRDGYISSSEENLDWSKGAWAIELITPRKFQFLF
jgi:hypothetical protein